MSKKLLIFPIVIGLLVTVSSGATGTSYTIVNPTIDSLWANSELQGKAKVRQFIRDVARLNDFNADEFLFTAIGESNLNRYAVGDHGQSYGVWQIHLPAHPKVTKECATNVLCATKYAVKLWKETPLHWTCLKELRGLVETNNCKFRNIEIPQIQLAEAEK